MDKMLLEIENMMIRLFILQIGKSKNGRIYRVAYGVCTPYPGEINAPFVSEPEEIGSCEHGKLYVRKIVWASTHNSIMAIYKDLASGISLKTIFEKWGINTDRLNYDATYNQATIDIPWGIESILENQLTFSKSICMLDPDSLFEKDDKIPSDVEQARKCLEDYLQKCTGLPFGEKFDQIGNLSIIIEPDRDANGKPFVECCWEKESIFALHIKIRKELTYEADTITINVRFSGNEKVLRDEIRHIKTTGNDIEATFNIEEAPIAIETKIWMSKDDKCSLIHQSSYFLLHQIKVAMSVTDEKMKCTSEWLQKIRKNLPTKNKSDVDEAEIIERKSKETFIVGKSLLKRKKIKRPEKTNDEFFPTGWDTESKTQGMLSFLTWFRKKSEGALGIFLQDPYFEDVALYFIASSDNECEYTVLTQTQLKTNPDGTNNTYKKGGEDNKRRKKIVTGIKSHPQLFKTMKLIVKDIPITHNVLHDRYLIFDYGNNHLKGYMLSNSLQGATSKHPLLITQIGDNAFTKVRKHIDNTLERDDIETIYDYSQEKGDILKDVGSEVIADKGFFDWLLQNKKVMINGNVDGILYDIKSWRTYDKMSTLGYFLATINSDDSYQIINHLIIAMAKDCHWVSVLSGFILKMHYSPYPVGYINSIGCYIHNDYTQLLAMDYQQIVTPYNVHLLDFVGCERYSFRVYGQYYAAKFIIKLSETDAIRILKQLRPTLTNISEDKTATPVFKVTQMLMTEMMEIAILEADNDKLMKALLNEQEAWCRGLGALMFLYQSNKEDIKAEEYIGYFKNDDELITLCHAAWGMKPRPANMMIYYRWLVDIFKRINNSDLFKSKLIEVFSGVHCAEDKAEYIKKVVLPMIKNGLIDKNEIAHDLITKFYEQAVCNNMMMREALVECLYILDGDIQPLLDKAHSTLDEFPQKINRLPVKNNDNIFKAACPCIYLQIFLIQMIKRYEDKEDSTIKNLKDLLSAISDILNDYGLGKTKQRYTI